MEKARRELLYWRSSDDWVASLHVSLQHNPERLSGTTRGLMSTALPICPAMHVNAPVSEITFLVPVDVTRS